MTESEDKIAASGINTPNLTGNLRPQTRAIKDVKQATSIVRQLVRENESRNVKNSRISAKYNAETPYNKADLDADGLGWKNNFSTKPLGLLIDKISPRFTKAIQGVRYLTSSAFPDSVPGASKKTEMFRSEVTKTIRARPGWKDFITEFAQENALFGFTNVACTDEFAWMPRHYRQDEFFIPRGTKQNSAQAQLIVLKDTFLLHELFSLVSDQKAAADAGWNIDNVIDSLNKALPESTQSKFSDSQRVYEDLVREVNVAAAHSDGAKVVVCYHLFATEIDGKISHWIVSGENENMRELFVREDRFDSMSACNSFFAFQYGNGTMHGSKGIGREVYAMAGVLDRARNEVVDRLQLSGKLVLQADSKMIKRFRMSVMGNAVLISDAYEIKQEKIEAAVEPFFQLDSYLTSLLDQIAGTVSPKVLEGERVTKAAVDLLAGREEERRDVIIDRFMSQVADMVTMMQRRMCSPQCSDADAQQMQERLLRVMTREELDQISKEPAASTVADYTEQQRQQVVLIAQEAKGNPFYNQRLMEHEKLTALLGAEFADRVLLPENDPAEEAEQSRTQAMEIQLMLSGRPCPVSPRDNHRIHLDNLYPAIDASIQALIDDPEALGTLKLLLEHGSFHVELGLANGGGTEMFGQDKAKFDGFIKVAADIEQHVAAAPPEALAASGIPDDSEAPPVPAI